MESPQDQTRSTIRRWAYWRWLFVGWVLVYALTVVSIGGSPAARVWFFAAAATWAVLLIGLLRWSCTPSALHTWLRHLDLVATNLALLLLLCELGLRAYGAWSGHALILDERLEGWRLAPNRSFGGLLTTNSHGYPSREFHMEKRPGVRRIAALGDSFAVGVVPQQQNFLTLLEQKLPDTEVYNFGVTGIGPREYDSILRSEVWRFQPDLMLVCFFVGNDVTGWWRLPSAAKLDPKAHRLYVLGHRAWRLGRESLRRAGEAGECPTQPFEFPQLSRQTHLEHEVQRLAVCRHSQSAAVEKSWKRTLSYLDSIRAQCQDRGVPLAVVLIPDEVQVNPSLLQEVLQFAPIPPDDIDLATPQRRLCAYFMERGVPCLDLMPAFASEPETYRPRDTHWNEKGNRLAAKVIAEWIR